MPPESWCNATGIVVQCHRILQANSKIENLTSLLPFVSPKITHKDLADTVRVWLHSHPKLRGIPSGLSIIEALAERFPCK